MAMDGKNGKMTEEVYPIKSSILLKDELKRDINAITARNDYSAKSERSFAAE